MLTAIARLLLLVFVAGLAALQPGPVAASAIDRALGSVVRLEPAWAGSDGPALGRSLGSGFVFDAEGHLVTNAHVVGDATELTAVFADGTRRTARLVGRDPLTDVAVLEAGAGLQPLAQGEPAGVRAGDRVFAIGSPLAFPFSVTEGVISGAGRAYDAAWPIDFLQHDAALNPGSSGGPLIDAQGRALGMNTATPGETLFDIGIGLAIPIDRVRTIATALIADRGVVRGQLGLRVRAADAAMLATLGLGGAGGLMVDEVTPGGAAARAGIASGAVILAIDGDPMRLPRDLAAALDRRRPGDRVALELAGADGTARREVMLGRAADDSRAPHPSAAPVELGLRLVSRVDAGPGLLVNDVARGSLAETYGLRRDDLVLAINGQAPETPEAAAAALAGSGDYALFRVERQGRGVRHLMLPLNAEAARRRPAGLPVDLASGPL